MPAKIGLPPLRHVLSSLSFVEKNLCNLFLLLFFPTLGQLNCSSNVIQDNMQSTKNSYVYNACWSVGMNKVKFRFFF